MSIAVATVAALLSGDRLLKLLLIGVIVAVLQ